MNRDLLAAILPLTLIGGNQFGDFTRPKQETKQRYLDMIQSVVPTRPTPAKSNLTRAWTPGDQALLQKSFP